ncbi:phosphate ABC transporter permease subunit PstC [Tengunoibacter tsumagoiensis]|uniref:Phosphate transport system permease protein n=1 Tax=Tengunoibacter tsumagoiensis TaxID=2014871 RepID=A0A401ZWA2_9CHLR|nr:phosphate ABC transporter permease subunit PstC [Tengunoibacter tsumagoiensis]GCE11086.1 putative ABC transporter permease protein YqgH [Tengunoibacter tsumagoiensis]
MADSTTRADLQEERQRWGAGLSKQSSYVRRTRLADRIANNIFLICAILIVVIILAVFIFVGINGFQMFNLDPHSKNFLTSAVWDPQGNKGPTSYGMLGFILGSVVTTALAVIISTPLAFGMALFMTEVTPKWLENILRPLLEIFTGMPSVIIGFLALVSITPILRDAFGKNSPIPAIGGYGWAAAVIVLIIMILPTIISVSIDALRAVPSSVREASLALGSSRWQMMRNAVLPAASTGLATAVVLGMTRAIGEALAVSMVLKGNADLPKNLFSLSAFFQPNINMTLPIVLNFPDASGAERDAYFMVGFLLLVISFLFVCISRYLASRSVYK